MSVDWRLTVEIILLVVAPCGYERELDTKGMTGCENRENKKICEKSNKK